MNIAYIGSALVLLCVTGQQRPLEVSKPLPTISATAASGRWLERAALNPATYGRVSGVSPASTTEAKVVLYTATLSEDFFRLAQGVDRLLEKHPELAWSFVQLSDPKGAQYGGYTADELQTRLNEIKTLVEKHKIKHLSFLISAPPARPGDTTVTLAFSEQTTVGWTTQTNASKLTKATRKKLIEDLSATIGK
jgi:hypothetical protein